MTTVWPSWAATSVLAERMVVVGPTWFGSPASIVGTMSDTSSKRLRRTKSSAVICGVRRSVMPTSCRTMVVKRFWRLLALVARLATKGTFRPTTISASSLSVVMRFGAESTFTVVSFWRAVRSAVWAGTSCPFGKRTFWLLAAARTRPASEVGSVRALVSGLRFVCASPTAPSSWAVARNSTPRARMLSSVASRMIASTKTCGRRMSSSSITSRRVAQSAGVALTTSALVAASAVMRTGASSGIVPAPLAGGGSAATGGAGGGSPRPPSYPNPAGPRCAALRMKELPRGRGSGGGATGRPMSCASTRARLSASAYFRW